jgi:L-fuconolactonase
VIVDTHVHIVSDDRERFRLKPSPLGHPWWTENHKDAAGLIDLMQQNAVGQALVVQPVLAYGYDNSYLLHEAAQATEKLWAVPAVDLDDENLSNKDVENRLSQLASSTGVVGVRLFAVAPGSQWTERPQRAAAAFAAARKSGLVAVLTVFPQAAVRLRPLIEDLPDLRVALDHCGFPELSDGLIPSDAPLLSLVDLPNVALKVSSYLLHQATDPGQLVSQLAGSFGEDRLMWGSDYPQTGGDYPGMLQLAREASGRLSEQAATKFLGLNALRLFQKP